MTDTPPPDLGALRSEIDRIDEAMHRLLMERGEIIDRLIAVKNTSESGSAFRPGREAAMMRALAERHRGLLPLDTAESIWRVIIATFTYVQAPYRGPCRRVRRRRTDARRGPLPFRLHGPLSGRIRAQRR